MNINGNQYNRKQRLSLLLYGYARCESSAIYRKYRRRNAFKYERAEAHHKPSGSSNGWIYLQFKDRHPMALSGGQKQRVAIATALISDREILVFDEPTSGLDLQHMQEVANELTAIQDMGKTSLVITHDYELIVSCCTYVLHLENGKIQEQYVLDEKGIQRLKTFFMKTR